MFKWRNFHFFSFTTNPRFPHFVLSVRCKSGVTFVWRCFRDEISAKPPSEKLCLENTGSDWFASKDHLLDMSEPQVLYGKFLCCSSELPDSNYVTRTPSLFHCSTAEDGFKTSTAELWRSDCEHMKKVEAEYWARDNLCESEIEKLVINLAEDS